LVFIIGIFAFISSDGSVNQAGDRLNIS